MTTVDHPQVQAEFSSLQLLSHDQAANAPELDIAGPTRSLNDRYTGLQVFTHEIDLAFRTEKGLRKVTRLPAMKGRRHSMVVPSLRRYLEVQ